jgi:hypothetical protein
LLDPPGATGSEPNIIPSANRITSSSVIAEEEEEEEEEEEDDEE